MKPQLLLCSLLLLLLTPGCVGTNGSRVNSHPAAIAEPDTRAMFFPPPLADDWTKWIVGEWEGAGTSDAGKGRGVGRFELALGGQFLICRGQAEITDLDPDYLKKHMNATDAEVERFRRSGYQQLEVYTIDQKTGDVIGFLFDSLRCVATGRGKRESYREIVDWEWRTGHKSTRITRESERRQDDGHRKNAQPGRQCHGRQGGDDANHKAGRTGRTMNGGGFSMA